MLHAQVMLVDNFWVSLGRANFDPRRFFLNDELNLSLAAPDPGHATVFSGGIGQKSLNRAIALATAPSLPASTGPTRPIFFAVSFNCGSEWA